MYSISPRMSNRFSSNDELNDLLDNIERKIGILATNQYNIIRFGFSRKIDLDLYQDLLTYKEILLDKLLGCNCLENVMLISLNDKLKKITL